MNIVETILNIQVEHIRNLFGQFDSHAKLIEKTMEVTLIARDSELKILGDAEKVVKTKSVLEELEESEDYRQRLTMCPECGTDSFDLETGICINCGFSTLTEDTDADADMPDYLKILKLKKMSASQLELERKGMETFIINSIDKCKKAKAANWSTTTLCVPNGLYTYDNMREATQYIFDELAKAGFPGGEVTPHDKRLLLIPLKDDADLTGLAKDLKDKEDKILRNFNPNDPISAGRRAAAEFERSPYDASSF
jgi:hypothetical protein